MFGGIDPKKMQAMMRQMGIKQEEIEASRVIIETNEKKIVIESPSVQKITIQGNVSWQIAGEAIEEILGIRKEDIKIVAEKANVSEKEAEKALEKTQGDIAAAIIELQK